MWKRLHFPRDVVEGRTIHCEFLLVLNEVSLDHNMTHAFWCIAVCWFYNKSPKLENTDTVNNICPKRHHNEKLTCLWMLSMTWIASEVNLYCFIKCRFEQTEIIHPAAETSRASRSSLFFFLTSTDAALSVVWVNTDLIKYVMALQLWLIFATFSWSLSAAH